MYFLTNWALLFIGITKQVYLTYFMWSTQTLPEVTMFFQLADLINLLIYYMLSISDQFNLVIVVLVKNNVRMLTRTYQSQSMNMHVRVCIACTGAELLVYWLLVTYAIMSSIKIIIKAKRWAVHFVCNH